MYKKLLKISIFIFSVLFLYSCKNVKIEDDYYYEESETVDGMKITLKGKGYGVYGQLIEKYKAGSIKGLMSGTPLKIKTGSADDNNASYNEIYLSFEVNGHVDSFETEVEVLKLQGLSQIRVYYTDQDDKEYSLKTVSSDPFNKQINVDVDKDVKSIVLYIKGMKFYPTTFSSVYFKGDMKTEEFEKIKGKQINNQISINNIKIIK